MTDNLKLLALTIEEFIKQGKRFGIDPIQEDTTQEGALRNVYSKFAKTAKDDETAAELAEQYFTYAKWNFAKAVYRFDGDFLKILMDSEDVKISRDVFDNLAVPCFFVCDVSSDDMGFFVYVETTDEVVKFSVVSLIRLDEKRVGACNDSIWIPNGMMLSEGLKLWQDTVNPNTISPALLDMARKDMTRAIQTAYYLSSLNVVMREERILKQKRPRTSNGKPLNIHLWNVGYRLSCNYPAYEDGSYVLVDGNGSTEIADKKAIRRAHYEVIPVSQDAIKVKWVEPKEL